MQARVIGFLMRQHTISRGSVGSINQMSDDNGFANFEWYDNKTAARLSHLPMAYDTYIEQT